MILIGYASPKLQKACTNPKEARKALPLESADRVIRRLTELAAFNNLGEIPFRAPPLHFHLLGQDAKGVYAIKLHGGDGILFRPSGEFKTLPDGSADLSTVTAVTIEFIGNYHANV